MSVFAASTQRQNVVDTERGFTEFQYQVALFSSHRGLTHKEDKISSQVGERSHEVLGRRCTDSQGLPEPRCDVGSFSYEVHMSHPGILSYSVTLESCGIV